MLINSFDGDKIIYTCDCGNIGELDTSNLELQYLEEFGCYENINLDCEHCNMTHCVNMNLPIGEYDEVEFEFLLMPFEEIDQRKIIRNIMWAKRSDLQNMDRSEVDAQSLVGKEEILEQAKNISEMPSETNHTVIVE